METRDIAIWATFKETFCNLYHERATWLKLVFGPWLIVFFMVIISYLIFATADFPEVVDGQLTSEPSGTLIFGMLAFGVASAIASFVAVVMFSVRAVRYRLLGEVPEDYISFEWGKRQWKYLGISLLSIIILGFPASIAYENTHIAVTIGIFLVCLFIISRISLFGAIVSTDGESALKNSWKLTGGLIWLKLLALGFIVALPVSFVLNFITSFLGAVISPDIHSVATSLLNQFVTTAATTSAIASAYRQVAK